MVLEKNFYEPLDLERVVWAEPAVKAVAAELELRGSKRPLIAASPSCRKKTPVIADLLRALPHRSVGVYDAIVPHVSRKAVFGLVEMARQLDADLIVTVGGGSTIDTVKVALLGLAGGIRSESEFDALKLRRDDSGRVIPSTIPDPPIRQIVVPTTLSGAEFSDLAGCTNSLTRVKEMFTGRKIGSATVILDPAVTTETPLDIWLSTGIRSLDHAVESLCSLNSNPYVDALAVEAVRRLCSSLRRTHANPSDMAARMDGQIAVWLACAGLNRVKWGASHGLGHQLGALAKIPHGFCSCILLPHVLAYNRSFNADRQRLIETAMDVKNETAAEAISRLVGELDLPLKMSDLGINKALLPEIAATSMQNMFVRQNPRPIRTEADLLEILEAAF
jgi:alcohol dehydrogenase class IV